MKTMLKNLKDWSMQHEVAIRWVVMTLMCLAILAGQIRTSLSPDCSEQPHITPEHPDGTIQPNP